MQMKKSTEEIDSLREKFKNYYPGGHSNLRDVPISMRTIVSHAEGSRFWDFEGTEYIDYACAFGPNILGHRHPDYINVLQQSMNSAPILMGGGFAFSENDVIAAEKLVQHVPCAERVKFTTSGTEAVQVAMRVSRSYTRRPYVLMFEGHYHGWLDNVFGFSATPELEEKPLAVVTDKLLGHAPGAEASVLMIEWNNIVILENTLKKWGDEIAMIMMEPFSCKSGWNPLPGYLENVRKLCDFYGIVLCFDEIQTGFRAGGLSCAQGLYGVTPDITTLGKALGGGMPVSAVVGKAEVMDILAEGKTLAAGTYMGHCLSVQAVVATLDILEHNDGAVYTEIDRVQTHLITGLNEIAMRRGIPLRLEGFTSWFLMMFGVYPDTIQYTKSDARGLDRDMGMKFYNLIHNQGILCAENRWLLSIMHTDQDTSIALEAADKAMSKL